MFFTLYWSLDAFIPVAVLILTGIAFKSQTWKIEAGSEAMVLLRIVSPKHQTIPRLSRQKNNWRLFSKSDCCWNMTSITLSTPVFEQRAKQPRVFAIWQFVNPRTGEDVCKLTHGEPLVGGEEVNAWPTDVGRTFGHPRADSFKHQHFFYIWVDFCLHLIWKGGGLFTENWSDLPFCTSNRKLSVNERKYK